MSIHKYRAWDRQQRKMIPVSNISFGDDGKALTVIIWDKSTGQYDRPLVVGEQAELMQYTDIRDRNGKEIYEGDIVLYLDNTAHGLVAKTAIIDDIRYLPDFMCSKWQEVIGNICEQKELLRS